MQVPYYLAELTEKIIQDDRIQILKSSQAKLKVFYGCSCILYSICRLFLRIIFQSHVLVVFLALFSVVKYIPLFLLLCHFYLWKKGFTFQEFLSFCEAMELVPGDELEESTKGNAGTPAERRARKVLHLFYVV